MDLHPKWRKPPVYNGTHLQKYQKKGSSTHAHNQPTLCATLVLRTNIKPYVCAGYVQWDGEKYKGPPYVDKTPEPFEKVKRKIHIIIMFKKNKKH